MNTQQAQKVRQKIETALSGIMHELDEISAGKKSVSTKNELEFLQKKLQELLESINIGNKIEIAGLWRIVIDTWPHTNKLRQQIVEAEFGYERLK